MYCIYYKLDLVISTVTVVTGCDVYLPVPLHMLSLRILTA